MPNSSKNSSEVFIYLLHLTPEIEEFVQRVNVLDEHEHARRERFIFDHSKHQYGAGHTLLRYALSRHSRQSIAPSEWRFAAAEHGKPYVLFPENETEIQFNLSHTEGAVAVAIAHHGVIGVDIEFRERASKTVEIAERFFSPREVAELSALPTLAAKKQRFYTLWTLKEAYIKAVGKGLAIPLEQFSFELKDNGSVGISFAPELDDDPQMWQFAAIAAGEKHAAAVAVKSAGQPATITIREVDAALLATLSRR